uniref:G_PROTEIN_RECEP_F1_2 domain-containing protein n=1 Tax=Heligmosomoides polygyrus TaxID=6339 RepID=A0A183G9P2_HELPZ
LCWTPQWTLNIMSQFNLIHVTWMTPALSAIFFVAHLLVCFNSAANPVLYALINRELRQQHVMAMARKRQSFTHATHEALEFVARHTHKSALAIT